MKAACTRAGRRTASGSRSSPTATATTRSTSYARTAAASGSSPATIRKRLVYEHREPGAELIESNLYVVESGGSPRLLTPGTDPHWSPDGKRILFKAWLPERKQLVVSTIAPDGPGLRHLAAGVRR